jgi:hypothetical protein
MSNYFTVLSDDWAQPKAAAYVPPSRRKAEPKSEPHSINNNDFPTLGGVVKKKDVLKMSDSCFTKAVVEENVKSVDEEFEEIKDDWYFCVLKDGIPSKSFTESQKKDFVYTAKRYKEDENNIPGLEFYEEIDEYIESESEEYSSDSDYYNEIKEDFISGTELNNYVSKVEKLKKKVTGTNLNNPAVEKRMLKVLVANEVKAYNPTL